MTLFGLVAEGPSDHAVLENILLGLFDEEDISDEITILQPLRDATEQEAIKAFGGWYKVFEYCRSSDFRGAFQDVQYLVIQIDTDVSEEIHYDVKQTDEDGIKLSPEKLIMKVKDKFSAIITSAFGEAFFHSIKDRLLFAISVNEIECWLLPLYYTDKTKMASNNCDYKLHQKAGAFSKEYRAYSRISKNYQKAKILKKSYPDNPSFRIFIEDILSKDITLD